MQFSLIEHFNQYKDCPITKQALFLEPNYAQAMQNSRLGWCYGISATFIRYCNELPYSDMCDVGEEAKLLSEYEEFLRRQMQKLRRPTTTSSTVTTLTLNEQKILLTQVLQNCNLENLAGVPDHPRNVWAFRDYNWTSCKMDGNVLRLSVGSGHAVAVDLTMRHENTGFIFDPNRGLFKAPVSGSEDGRQVVMEWIRQDPEYSKWCLRQDKIYVANQLLEAVVNWWRDGREGKQITSELTHMVENMVGEICNDAFGQEADERKKCCLGSIEQNTLYTDISSPRDSINLFAAPLQYEKKVLDEGRPNPRIVVSGHHTGQIRQTLTQHFPFVGG